MVFRVSDTSDLGRSCWQKSEIFSSLFGGVRSKPKSFVPTPKVIQPLDPELKLSDYRRPTWLSLIILFCNPRFIISGLRLMYLPISHFLTHKLLGRERFALNIFFAFIFFYWRDFDEEEPTSN